MNTFSITLRNGNTVTLKANNFKVTDEGDLIVYNHGQAQQIAAYRKDVWDGVVRMDALVEQPKPESSVSREAWLHNNPEALASVKLGLEQSAQGKVKDLGDFTQYVDDEDEDTEWRQVGDDGAPKRWVSKMG